MDRGTFFVALITLVLFIAALFTKGITQDIFLEAGVFLVSVKILISSYRNSMTAARNEEKLDKILAELQKGRGSGSDNS